MKDSWFNNFSDDNPDTLILDEFPLLTNKKEKGDLVVDFIKLPLTD